MRLQAVKGDDIRQLRYEEAIARMVAAQFAVVERLSQHPDGSQRHPWLLEQYGDRVRMAERYGHETEALAGDRKEHFDRRARSHRGGREEILRLHRSWMIRDEVLRSLESDLDLGELAARAARP